MIATQTGQGKKRIGLISTGIVGALLVAFTFTPTFAGFAASIQNTINSASTGRKHRAPTPAIAQMAPVQRRTLLPVLLLTSMVARAHHSLLVGQPKQPTLPCKTPEA